MRAPLPARELDAVIELLREALGRTLDDVSTLHAVAPNAFPQDAILDSYTDVFHRSLFGLRPDVNVHERRLRRPRLALGPIMQSALDLDTADDGDRVQQPAALAALLEAAHMVFLTRGYHGTRVDDIVEAAGVSHGAFYRYFKNKDELAHLLAAQAMRTVSSDARGDTGCGGGRHARPRRAAPLAARLQPGADE